MNRLPAGAWSRTGSSDESANRGRDGPPAPAISLPKGGGAIRGVGEKFAANPVTGTGSLSVPFPVSPGRSGFGPQLSLSYDSGAGNGPFGFGWAPSLPSITRKTDKGLPQYRDSAESDVFLLSGAEDLVPVLDGDNGWERVRLEKSAYAPGYVVDRYRPRIEGLFARIERWTRTTNGDAHWRSITRDNVTTVYGADGNSRIEDPEKAGGPGARVFGWLICESYDDRGNRVVYTYKPEDDTGVDTTQAHEGNRTSASRSANRYLKSIRYGNRVSRLVDPDPADPGWMFEVVFDYGEHDPGNPKPGDQGEWLCRHDPFSSYRAGFEVRSYRLCQRILMFHHFPVEPDVEQDCLVRSMELTYRSSRGDPQDARRGHPVASFVAAITQRGFRRSPTGYTSRSLPPLEVGYTEVLIDEELHALDAASLANLPGGVDGAAYQWLDLDGEGVAGILTEQTSGWFYKPNLGDGRFGPIEQVASVPSMAAASGRQQFLDLAGDGQLDLVDLDGPTPGFSERGPDHDWEPLVAFRSMPNLAWDDPNLRFADLTGDGHADVLMLQDEALIWYAALGEEGFAPAEHLPHALDADTGPRLVFTNSEESVHLADMSGDGLSDLVLIRNGEVSYRPNLGYGRFGAAVSMDDSPWFDRPDRFEPRRVLIADIDGSGTTDLIYVGADGIRIWANEAGNRWSRPHTLAQTPPADDVTSVTALDLLGNGTACLVWSSALPGEARRPVRYIDLMGGQKPHLLVSVKNNLGAETVVTYAPSTRFYLADKHAGRPWATRLPFPVHVVERVETLDRISGNRFVTRSAYHHGHFDGEEREFRGFGMVEQWDTEEYAVIAEHGVLSAATNLDASSHVPPVLTRTWFHTGAYRDGAAISRALAHEYYGAPATGDGGAQWDAFDASLLPDTVLPGPVRPGAAWLDADELREACRALKGAVLRQEVYALDGSDRAALPYTVSERNYTIRPLQPRGANRHAVFLTHPREEISQYHERARYPTAGGLVADPRVSHTLTLDVDDYGNVRASAAIGYGRQHDDPDSLLTSADRAAQARTLATYSVNRFTDPVLSGAAYRTPAPYETCIWELTAPGLGDAGRLGFDEVLALVQDAAPLAYEDQPSDADAQLRLVEHLRTRYRADNLTSLLPLGQVGSLALPGQSERCAFTPGLLTQRYGNRVSDAMLVAAGHVHSDGDASWWIPSGRAFYSSDATDAPAKELAHAREHFFLPHRMIDPFGNAATIGYDADDLLPVLATDRVLNPVSAVNDYRVLQPTEVTDPNRNRSAAAFDELGTVTATAVMGKAGETDPDRMGDTLTDPTSRLEYGLFEWVDHGRPAYVRTLAREEHRTPDTRWQETFVYSDGFGREIQHKGVAEPGPAGDPRWVGSGWVVFNNKGKPVRQYEPFFTATSAFEVKEQGVASTLCYDPVGRVVATLHPDATWEKVAFDPWRQETWDANDTVFVADPAADPDVGDIFGRTPATAYLPTWYARRAGGAMGADQQAAAAKAAAHAATPALTYLDSLGRAFLTVADNGADGRYATRMTIDIEGNTHAVTDPRGVVTTYDYDMLGNVVSTVSPDAGPRRTLTNVLGNPVQSWDDRGFSKQLFYDAEQRPTERRITLGTATRVAERTVYGEARGDADNHRGRVYQVFDGAGVVTTTSYDFKGNPAASTRQLLRNYRDPVDWTGNPLRETETFDASSTYDAFNRPVTATTHDGSVIRHKYDEAGLLDSVTMNLRGASTATTVLADVDYNAKAQRERADLRITDPSGIPSVVTVNYGYDPLTFRLISLTAIRATDGRRLQDLGYTYDPVGNITAIRDTAQPTIFSDNQLIPAGAEYRYDPVYRLVEATGREHDGSGTVDPPSKFPQWKPHYDANDSTRRGKTHHPNDKFALRRYTQTYTYDGIGNILSMAHRPAGGGGWTRFYEYASDSNRLLGTTLPGDPVGSFSARYTHDAHGNMLTMPHLPVMAWDADDRLQQTQQQVVNAGIGERTWYVYDASGERIRKVTERPGGTIKNQRIYLGGLEYFRTYDNAGTLVLERETLHVMDNTRRIALVDTKTRENHSALPVPESLLRYQLGNHLDSTALELDDHGHVITFEEYYPYGSTAYQAGRTQVEVKLKRYRYTGKERDEETGLAYHGARYYAPWLGRWTSHDPVLVFGKNPYVGLANSPVRFVDPAGTQEHDPAQPDIPVRVTRDDIRDARKQFALGVASSLLENLGNKSLESLIGPGAGKVAQRLGAKLDEPMFGRQYIDRSDLDTKNWNPLSTALAEGYLADQRVGHGFILLSLGEKQAASVEFAHGGYRYGEMIKAAVDFGGVVTAAAGVVMAVGKAAKEAKIYIVYVFRDPEGKVRYVGRASGFGSTLKVLWNRITKGHDVAKLNPHLEPEVFAEQGSKAANAGAEQVFHDLFKTQGADLLNAIPPLSERTSRLQKTTAKIAAFFADTISWPKK
jgi:RHS repeat-associated protein